MFLVYCVKYAWKSLSERFGQILVISSMAGEVGLPLRTAYCASKFAVTGGPSLSTFFMRFILLDKFDLLVDYFKMFLTKASSRLSGLSKGTAYRLLSAALHL